MDKQKIDEAAAKVGKAVLRHLDRAVYEMAEAVTVQVAHGSTELVSALYTGQAYSPHAGTFSPTDLPQHGDPGVWGAQITPSESEPEAVSSGITTDDDPRLWNARKMSANMSTFSQEASMIGKSLSETIVDKGAQGRDEVVAKIENPLEGLQGHEAQPDMGVEVEMEMEPEPEPEPEMD